MERQRRRRRKEEEEEEDERTKKETDLRDSPRSSGRNGEVGRNPVEAGYHKSEHEG